MKKLLPILLLTLTFACSNSYSPAGTTAHLASPESTPIKSSQRDERIRGNKRSMIYHWPGCPNYDDIAPQNRVYFKTRAEAEAAGYRAARNCK